MEGALDVAVKVAFEVVGHVIERVVGCGGEFRDGSAEQVGADERVVEAGEADEGGGRGPPHQRVCGIRVRGDVLGRGRWADEAGGEQRGGCGDRVLLVCGRARRRGREVAEHSGNQARR